MPDTVIAAFKPEYVFSITFFMVVVGTGIWFGRSGWKWLADYLNKRLELKHAADLERIRVEENRDVRWETLVSDLTKSFSELQHALGRFEALQQQFLNNQELFFRYLVKNGSQEDTGS